MKTSALSIPVGEAIMPAYYATPDSGKNPAVIVFQEIFGVNAQIRRIADLLADNGYAALAINYYHRTAPNLDEPYTGEGMQVGFAAAGQVSRETLRTDIEASIAWLTSRPEVDAERIASWGFCFGGTVAFYSATIPGIKAAIAFYGGSIAAPYPNGDPEGLSDTGQLHAPLLLAFGGQDDYIPADKIDRIAATLDAANKVYEMKVYPEESHAFFRQSSEAMDNSNVRDAWEQVTQFLGRTL